MRKSASVPIGIVAAVSALALSFGCGSPPPTHERLCGDASGNRVDDQNCVQAEADGLQAARARVVYHPLYFWHYGPYGRTYPMGSPLESAGASRIFPSGSGVRVGEVGVHPGTVRGGFGSSFHSIGG